MNIALAKRAADNAACCKQEPHECLLWPHPL